MPWGDKAVSPCVYTPGAGEMALDSGLSVVASKIVMAGAAGWRDDFDTFNSSRWDTGHASASGGLLSVGASGASAWDKGIVAKTSLSGNFRVFFKFIYNGATMNPATSHQIAICGGGYNNANGGLGVLLSTGRLYAGNAVSATLPTSATDLFVVFDWDNTEKKATIYYGFSLTGLVLLTSQRGLSATVFKPMFSRFYDTHPDIPLDYVIVQTFATTPLAATLLTANAFQPTAPAKLATLPTAVLTLDTTGAAGTVALYLQHYNDEVGRWESYSGVANDDTDASFTLIGSYSDVTNNISLPTLPARAGEMVRVRLKFTSTDGTAPAPSFVSLSLSWTSDVTAPDAPTIAHIVSVVPEGEVDVGYRVGFTGIPAGARHLIVEGQINSGGFLPFSTRAKFESGQGYMKFRGSLDAVEAAGERNERHLSFMNDIDVGDIVQIKVAAEDDAGNRSAFTTSDEYEIEPAGGPVVTPALSIEDATLATGATGTIRVHLHGPTTENVTVDYASADDTATDPADYSGVSGTLTFTADPNDPHQYQDIAINATGDDPTPGTTAYNVVLSNASGASVDKATGVVSVQALDYVPVLVDSFTVEVSEREEIQVEVS